MSDVVVIAAYKNPIISKTIDSLVKYTPRNVPIYLIDQAEQGMIAQKYYMRECAAKHGDRIKIVDYFVSERIAFNPLGLVHFLQDHPQFDRLIKFDDDVIAASDYYHGLKMAYEQRKDTLLAACISTIQIWGLHIFKERCGIEIDERILNPEDALHILSSYPELATEIWEQTVPPTKILPLLQQGERFLEVPLFRKDMDVTNNARYRADFISHHYMAGRKDLLELCSDLDGRTKSDEINFQRCRQKTGRPVIMDTWNLVYHFSGAGWFRHAIKNEWNMIKDMEF
jgi:hypothetical protein